MDGPPLRPDMQYHFSFLVWQWSKGTRYICSFSCPDSAYTYSKVSFQNCGRMLYYLPWDANTMICAGGADKDACQVIIATKRHCTFRNCHHHFIEQKLNQPSEKCCNMAKLDHVRTYAHRTFSEVTLDWNHASILSARDARGRSGPHVERIWEISNQPLLRKVCFKNRCFTIKKRSKIPKSGKNLEKIDKKIFLPVLESRHHNMRKYAKKIEIFF